MLCEKFINKNVEFEENINSHYLMTRKINTIRIKLYIYMYKYCLLLSNI